MNLKTKGNRKRFLITTFIFEAFHLVLKPGGMILSIGSSMRRFGDPAATSGPMDEVVGKIGGILIQPGALIRDFLPRGFCPDLLEWFIFLSNRVLRGAAMAAILLGVRQFPAFRSGDARASTLLTESQSLLLPC